MDPPGSHPEKMPFVTSQSQTAERSIFTDLIHIDPIQLHPGPSVCGNGFTDRPDIFKPFLGNHSVTDLDTGFIGLNGKVIGDNHLFRTACRGGVTHPEKHDFACAPPLEGTGIHLAHKRGNCPLVGGGKST